MKPYFQTDLGKLYHGDCFKILSQINGIDLILTDPPYPDQHLEYGEIDISIFDTFDCKQIIFWSAKCDFPLNYTAIHIWDKKCGVGSMYERIFERNGGLNYIVYRYYLINSVVAANYTRDVFTGHPSQKPINLIEELINQYSKEYDMILDLFLGSGTTAIACERLNRRWIGIEISKKYCDIAVERIKKETAQYKLELT